MSDHKVEIDAITHQANEELRTLYDSISNEMKMFLDSHPGASQNEINKQTSRMVQKYRRGITSIITNADKQYKSYIQNYIKGIKSSLKSKADIARLSKHISSEKTALIEGSVQDFSRHLSAAVADTAGDVSFGKTVNVGKNTDLDRLCSMLSRITTEENYVALSSLMTDIPEVMGYEIYTSPTNKYGKARVRDVCDDLKGEYPKSFVFRGWHYNCRCGIHPIIPDVLMTAKLAQAGFVGRPKEHKITMPHKAVKFLQENKAAYSAVFPQIEQHDYVEFRGSKRFVADMSPVEQVSYYLESMAREGETFLNSLNKVEINVTELEKDVFMSTVPTKDAYRINMRESSVQDLASAFAKRNTGIPLNRQQVEATASGLHELTHTLSKDYSFGESIYLNVDKEMKEIREKEALLAQDKNLSAKERAAAEKKIQLRKDIIEKNRNTIIDFHHGFVPHEVNTLEMLVEWKMRDIYPEYMKRLGLTLPANYQKYISLGYNNEVKNLTAFMGHLPVNSLEVFKKDIDEILHSPDKAFTFQKMCDAVRRTGVLQKRIRSTEFTFHMQGLDSEDFQYVLEISVEPLPKEPADTPAKKADTPASKATGAGKPATTSPKTVEEKKVLSAVTQPAEEKKALLPIPKAAEEKTLPGPQPKPAETNVKPRPIDLKKDVRSNSIISGNVVKGVVKGTLVGGAVTFAADAAGNVIDPNAVKEDKRYIPKIFYKNRYDNAIVAGLMDGALNTVVDLSEMSGNLITMQYYMMNPFKWDKAFDIYKEMFSQGEELAEFMYMLCTDSYLRQEVWNAIKQEFFDYIDSLAGFSPENGYAQGKLIFDIASLFVGMGELKAALNIYKRANNVSYLKNLISKGFAKYKKVMSSTKTVLPAKSTTPSVPKTNIPKANEHPVKTESNATISKVSQSNTLKTDDDGLTISTGYHQNKTAMKSAFHTYGKKLRGDAFKNFEKYFDGLDTNPSYIKTMYKSGASIPRNYNVTESMELYKIVPKNAGVHRSTPYWMTKEELINVLKSDNGMENLLALPEKSCTGVYDIHKITLKSGQNPENVTIFESIIAPARQGGLKRKGGAKQILVIDRELWTDVVKVNKLDMD